jgi:hypothetical protein
MEALPSLCALKKRQPAQIRPVGILMSSWPKKYALRPLRKIQRLMLQIRQRFPRRQSHQSPIQRPVAQPLLAQMVCPWSRRPPANPTPHFQTALPLRFCRRGYYFWGLNIINKFNKIRDIRRVQKKMQRGLNLSCPAHDYPLCRDNPVQIDIKKEPNQ